MTQRYLKNLTRKTYSHKENSRRTRDCSKNRVTRGAREAKAKLSQGSQKSMIFGKRRHSGEGKSFARAKLSKGELVPTRSS